MKYDKPELFFLSSAAVAIQSGESKYGQCQDNVHPEQGKNGTCPAYEADE
jgi:hypothetical protein